MQDLNCRSQAPRQLNDCLAKENKPGGVILVVFAILSVDPVAIEEFVTANEKKLKSTRTAAFKVFCHVAFVSQADIHRYPGVPG